MLGDGGGVRAHIIIGINDDQIVSMQIHVFIDHWIGSLLLAAYYFFKIKVSVPQFFVSSNESDFSFFQIQNAVNLRENVLLVSHQYTSLLM